VTLVAPEADAVVAQNDSTSGCPFDVRAGAGSLVTFDWEDLAAPGGLAGYEILVQKGSALFPIVEASATTSQYVYKGCRSFVADKNLGGWLWRVRGVDRLGQFGPWVERSFSFAPCRIGRRHCGT
jgi:hypothetical protein